MRILKTALLKAFARTYADAEEPLLTWIEHVEKVWWNNPNEVKADYPSASVIGNNRVVFNIKGNDYRLIVAISYRAGIVLIKFIGTHAAYDKVDAHMVEMENKG